MLPGFDVQFGAAKADADLDAYRRAGPKPMTRRLLDAIRELRGDSRTLLDIGSGVGVIAHELVAKEMQSATLVDLSGEYLTRALSESARRGTSDRVTVLEGDVVAIASTVPTADVVTLDRVICCYADLQPLIAASASRARRLYGVTYPRNTWWVRMTTAFVNANRRRRGRLFRTYLFPVRDIDAAIEQQGFTRRRRRRGLVWEMALWERTSGHAT
jgi:hypothetical protein